MDIFERIREFRAARKRRKLLAEYRTLRHAEDDRLNDDQKRGFDAVISELEDSPAPPAEAVAAARASFARLDLGLRHMAVREILDLLIVVGAVAGGIRGLFLQPFRIPTGSMQPTLFGIHYQYRDGSWRDKLPAPLQFVCFARRRARLTVEADGYFDPCGIRISDGFFKTDTTIRIGERSYTLPGAPEKVLDYAGILGIGADGMPGIDTGKLHTRGETLADGFVALGDHLFVERCSLYLVPPRRGDVMVFNTEGLSVDAGGRSVPLAERSGYYYIKRLVGLPGDTLKIENGFLYIKPAGDGAFRRADELDPRFGKVFSREGGYQGYTNESNGRFLREGEEYQVPEKHYFMLGDNTNFSMDSRYFGAVPRRNLVGRALLVFWPFSRRWGAVDSRPPLPVPTEKEGRTAGTFKVMRRQ